VATLDPGKPLDRKREEKKDDDFELGLQLIFKLKSDLPDRITQTEG
jgi:hypothetical protein